MELLLARVVAIGSHCNIINPREIWRENSEKRYANEYNVRKEKSEEEPRVNCVVRKWREVVQGYKINRRRWVAATLAARTQALCPQRQLQSSAPLSVDSSLSRRQGRLCQKENFTLQHPRAWCLRTNAQPRGGKRGGCRRTKCARELRKESHHRRCKSAIE